jgi:hypothetical protein
MTILISILLVLVLINLIVSMFVGIILVRVLESVIELVRDTRRTKDSGARSSKTRSGLPPGLVDVGATNYDVHGNPDDTHNFQDQTVK